MYRRSDTHASDNAEDHEEEDDDHDHIHRKKMQYADFAGLQDILHKSAKVEHKWLSGASIR